MSVKYLGIPFDIHCGGIDHILIHHTNEITQAEAGYGKILARFWLHGEFLTLREGKMGKSEGNIIILENLIEKGFNPLAYRYLSLTSHYRSRLNFSWQALKAAQNALNNLYQKMTELTKARPLSNLQRPLLCQVYQKRFLEFINNDLDIPKALALMWEVIKDEKLKKKEKKELLLEFDQIFGLDLAKVKKPKVPREIKKLVEMREEYRKKGNFKLADEIRREIKQMGYWIEDTKKGPKIKKFDK
jgi:cysteinyl-tRNA synthetase